MNYIALTPDLAESDMPPGNAAFQRLAPSATYKPSYHYNFDWDGLRVSVKTREMKYPEALNHVYIDQQTYDQDCDVYVFMAFNPSKKYCTAIGCTPAGVFRKYAFQSPNGTYAFPVDALIGL